MPMLAKTLYFLIVSKTEIIPTDAQLVKINEIGECLGSGTMNVFGPQWAGKDTNLEPFSKIYNVPIIGGGDILRNSEIPAHIKVIMESGELIPSEDYKEIVLPYLGQPAFEGKPLLLSSVGRMIGEEQGVLQATEAAGHPTTLAVQFNITREESFRRFETSPGRNRADDTAEALTTRLDFYEKYTLPTMDVYEDLGLLIKVDAMPEISVVFNSFVNQTHDRLTGKG